MSEYIHGIARHVSTEVGTSESALTISSRLAIAEAQVERVGTAERVSAYNEV